MADIYAGARSTLVWLGPADRLSNIALLPIPWMIERLSEQSGLIHGSDFETRGLDNMVIWEALGEFFHKPWFQRLWVLQEVVLARDVTLICGNVMIDWTVLTDLVNLIANVGLFELATGKHGWDRQKDHENGLFTIEKINRLRAMCQNENLKIDRVISVPHLMDAAWGKHCLEEVDRVWAVAGMLSGILRRDLFAQGFVDYSEGGRKNYEETYIKMFKWLADIDLCGLLSIATQSERSSMLPIWCPNWRVPPRCSRLGMHSSTAGRPTAEHKKSTRGDDGKEGDTEHNYHQQSTWSSTSKYITWSWNHNVLSVYGFCVDVIVCFTEDVWVDFGPTEDEDKQNTMEKLRWLAEATAVARTTLRTDEECFTLRPDNIMLIPTKFWEILIAETRPAPFGTASSQMSM